jgi:hypothetical protein
MPRTCQIPSAEHVARRGALSQRLCANQLDRFGGSVRPVSLGQADEDLTNARPGGTLLVQAHLGLF